MRGGAMDAVLDELGDADFQSLTLFVRPELGLRAVLVIDDTTLGPAAGGIRTRRYASASDAIADARRLAQAMTLKCAIAGLPAGGGKLVIMDDDALDRRAAFRWLGERVEELGGSFLTAGDLGTTSDDLAAMATETRFVRTDEGDLVDSVADGLVGCVRACCAVAGRPADGLRVAVQGCGSIGAAVAQALANTGARLLVADTNPAAAERVAQVTGAEVVDPADILTADVDIVSPCATGGVVTDALVPALRAWAVCGAANNVLEGEAAAEALRQRDILLVPDTIASAGAVIHGICDFQGMGDPEPLIAALGDTTRQVLESAREQALPTPVVAEALARERIREARR